MTPFIFFITFVFFFCSHLLRMSMSIITIVLIFLMFSFYVAMFVPIVAMMMITTPMPSAQMPRCTQLYFRSMI